MATYDKFKHQLARGHFYEKRSLLYLDYDDHKIIQGYHKEYDLEIIKDGKKITIEVKSDRQASWTGNLAIEYECKDKPSGITSSTADYWIYFIVFEDYEEVYKISLEKLRKIAKTCKKVIGGDNNASKMFLIPKVKLCNYLIKSQKNNETLYITPTMSDLKDQTQEQKPLSYSQRLINEFKEKQEKHKHQTYNLSQIESIINQFSKLEYEKRKKKTDEMPFGKYKHKKVSDVAKFDKQYLKWLSRQDMMNKYTELKDEINKHI
jgi:hypothetical protein